MRITCQPIDGGKINAESTEENTQRYAEIFFKKH